MKESMENMTPQTPERSEEMEAMIEKYGEAFEKFVESLDKPASIMSASTAYEQRNKKKKDSTDVFTYSETSVDIIFKTDEKKEVVTLEQEDDNYDVEGDENVLSTAVQIAKLAAEKGMPDSIIYTYISERYEGDSENRIEETDVEQLKKEIEYQDAEPYIRVVATEIIRQKNTGLSEDVVKEIYTKLYEG